MYPLINKLFYYGGNYIKSKAEMVTNLFWKQLLDMYNKLLTTVLIRSCNDLLASPVWHNQLCRIGLKSLIFNFFASKSLFLVNVLISIQDGEFCIPETLRETFNVRFNFLMYTSIWLNNYREYNQ